MDDKVTNFGKRCRKLRIDKGWTMADAAERLGCKQNHITLIEQGKTNPTHAFLEKCLEVYEIPEIEKADFIAQALTKSTRFVLDMDNVTSIPKEDLARIMAVLAFNLEEPYPATKEWKAAANAMKRLKAEIDIRAAPYAVALPDI